MKRIVCVVLAVLNIVIGQNALAIETSGTAILPIPPLVVTSYLTKDSGKDLQYIELYNNSKSLVRVEDWVVRDIANARDLQMSSLHKGALEPGKHIVASRLGIVPQASYSIDGWNTPGTNAFIATLQIVRNGYRIIDTSLSTKTDDRDKMMTRTYNSDSYSTAASPFVQVAQQNYRPQGYPLFEDGLYSAPSHPGIVIVEIYPYASNCPPFDPSVLCGDYVKLYNPSNAIAQLDGISLRTDSGSLSRTVSNTITLTGTMEPGEYVTVWLTDSSTHLALSNSGGYVWLEDKYASVVPYPNTLVHYESASATLQGYAFALNSEDSWVWTSTPMPTAANLITPVPTASCPDGKYRNPDTGRCRSLEETINALATCEEGYERNLTTNRCRKVMATSSTGLVPCKEGQERNPATNRCRSIASAIAELLPCDEGYERNPATNRCRKSSATGVLGADYPVKPYEQQSSALATWWIVGGIAALALGYAVWEWRQEIRILVARILRKK